MKIRGFLLMSLPETLMIICMVSVTSGCTGRTVDADSRPAASPGVEKSLTAGSASVFRGNFLRTGSFSALPVRSDPVPVWTFDAGSPIGAAPICPGENLYFGTEEGYVYQLDAKDGKIIWRFQTGGRILSAPAFSGNRLYSGSGDGKLYCIETRTAEVLWEFTADSAVRSSPVVDGGRLFFSSDSGSVYALDTETGSEIWTAITGSAINGSAAANDGMLFVSGTDGKLRTLEKETGSMIRITDLESGNLSGPVVGDNAIYVSNETGKLFALSGDGGSILWEFADSVFPGQVPAVTETAVFFATAGGEIFSLETGTGKILWKSSGFSGFTAPPAVADSVVYVPETDSGICGFDAFSGKLLWRLDTQAPVSTSIVPEGTTFFFGDGKGTVTRMTGSQADPVSAGPDTAQPVEPGLPGDTEDREEAATGSEQEDTATVPSREGAGRDDSAAGDTGQTGNGYPVLTGDGKIGFFSLSENEPLRLLFRPDRNGVYEFSLPNPAGIPVVLKLYHRNNEAIAGNTELDRLENSFTCLVRRGEEYVLVAEPAVKEGPGKRISLRIRLLREE